MRLITLALLLSTLFTQAYAQSLRIRFEGLEDDIDLLPKATLSHSGVNLTPVTARPSGDGTSSSAPARVYIPIRQGTSEEAKHPSIYSLNGSNQVNGVPPFQAGSYPGSVRMPLEVTVPSILDDHYLHVAVDTNNGWRVVNNTLLVSNGTNRQIRTKTILFSDFCATNGVSCSGLAGSGVLVEHTVYFFFAPVEIPPDDTINPSSSEYSHGVFARLYLSSRTNPGFTTNLRDIFRGDSSAVLEYTSTGNLAQLNRALVFAHSESNPDPNEFVGSYVGLQVFDQEFFPNVNGTATVRNLQNNRTYLMSIAMIDNFNFVTKLSNSRSVTPLQIEELLTQEACFIVTAGFGRDHFVVREMKKFRDHVLMNFGLGQRFVRFYYRVSPDLAFEVVTRPWLQRVVRGFSWTMTTFLHYLGVILMGAAFLLSIVIIKKYQGDRAHGRS